MNQQNKSEGTTPQAERPMTQAEYEVEYDKLLVKYSEMLKARAVAPVETPKSAKLMVTRGGEIHEECPDCRGECSPYKPAAPTEALSAAPERGKDGKS